MPFREILRMALQSIRGNLLRAILTLLIIAVGILALVGIFTAIDSIAYSLNDNFSGLGANSFTIHRKWGEVHSNRGGRQQKRGAEITLDQALEFKERFDFPAKVSVSFWATNLATVKYGETKTNPNIGLTGIDENYFAIKGMDIELGRNFSQNEVDEGRAVAVIGMDIVKNLFNGKAEKALDQVIIVGNSRYRVIGVLKSKGASMGNNTDRAVYAPLHNVRNQISEAGTTFDLMVAVQNAVDMDAAQSEAIGLFRTIRKLRPSEPDDFELFASDSLVAILKENTATLRLATKVIGAMTLLGAAIGLMNIMLVSVTERTREIGIYKALGATKRSILIQFLSEAVVISLIGGFFGILGGILFGNLIPLISGGNFHMPWSWVLLGIMLCLLVGVVSGLYPALKAAQLDPIEALRYE